MVAIRGKGPSLWEKSTLRGPGSYLIDPVLMNTAPALQQALLLGHFIRQALQKFAQSRVICQQRSLPEMHSAMAEESEIASKYLDVLWDEDGEQPPELQEDELAKVDAEADAIEIKRLMDMGVARWPKEGERIEEYQSLTTKVVRDWRRRPTWKRRSRLVGREFKSLSPCIQELFAPASTLAITPSRGQELCAFDCKDAYLQVDQPVPMTIEVNAPMFGEGKEGTVTLVLEKLFPGQRIGTSAWYNFLRQGLAGKGWFLKLPQGANPLQDGGKQRPGSRGPSRSSSPCR